MSGRKKAGNVHESLGRFPCPVHGLAELRRLALPPLAEWPNDGFTGIAAVPDMGRDANGRRIRAKSFTYADGATITSNVFERVAEGISLSAIGNRVENNLFISNFRLSAPGRTWSGKR